MPARAATVWIPQQHGAWAWLLAPPVVGACLAGWSWRHLLFIVAWLTAYGAYATWGRWLRVPPARRRPWQAPLAVYGAIALVAAAGLWLSEPSLWRWLPVFAPLFVVSLVCTIRHAEHSWLNNLVTTLAACLMTAVAAGLSGRAGQPGDQPVWLAASVLFAYFFGTVFYVKTLFRGRGRTGPYAASVVYHTAVAVAACWLSPWLGLVGLLLVARAVILPRWQPALPARYIGLGEFAATAVVSVVTVLVL